MKRKMVEVNKRQAFVIHGADILPNDRGTAPGQWIEESGACLMILPGPPHELKAMFTRQCLPRLTRIAPRLVIRSLVLRVAGMPESDLDSLIAPVYKKYDNPATTILAAAGDLQDSPACALRHGSGSHGAVGGGGRPHRVAVGRSRLFAQRPAARRGDRRTAARAACHAFGRGELHRWTVRRTHYVGAGAVPNISKAASSLIRIA